jgi:hypothetical protein
VIPRKEHPRATSLTVLFALAAGAAIGATIFGAGGVSSTPNAAMRQQQFILYSSPKAQTFVNNADDRTRGRSNNPFGNYNAGNASASHEEADGPFAGDEGLFAYTLFAGGKSRKRAGSAVLVCQYDFDKNSYCDATYQLDAGTLIGSGSFNYKARSFTLAITGGTGEYRGASGNVEASSPAANSARPTVGVLDVQRLVYTIQQPAASVKTQSLNPYSVATREQFIHNGDDVARGATSNPFDLRSSSTAAALSGRSTAGPSPGDEAVFRFGVYTKADMKRRLGSATFTCQYSFDTTAFCNASYTLPGGTLNGVGTFGFSATELTLAITGGTGKYAGITGQVEASPGANHAQRLAFELQRA